MDISAIITGIIFLAPPIIIAPLILWLKDYIKDGSITSMDLVLFAFSFIGALDFYPYTCKSSPYKISFEWFVLRTINIHSAEDVFDIFLTYTSVVILIIKSIIDIRKTKKNKQKG